LLLSKRNQFSYVALPIASARHTAHRAARRRQLRQRLASGCLDTLRGSSRRSLSTTPPREGLSSTTLPMPRVWVPRHVAWLISPLIVDYSASRRLVVDNSASCRLIVDYFASTARMGASARRAACCAARHRLLRLALACRRLLRLRLVSGCLGTSRGSSRGSSRRSSSSTPPRAGSSSITLPPPRVRVPRHVARLVTQLVAPLVFDKLRLKQACR
jgi:hypothetical protein